MIISNTLLLASFYYVIKNVYFKRSLELAGEVILALEKMHALKLLK